MLCLGCTCMLPGNDLSQLGVREEVVTEPSEIRCQMKGLSYNNNNNFDYNVIVMYMYTMECTKVNKGKNVRKMSPLEVWIPEMAIHLMNNFFQTHPT